ncbi:site-specific integrase [Candidatus Nitrosarchaeum limnium]|jgi:integrase|uniref:Site-specific recombinase, phage integrase family n=1 Tax=Candidatus Nitrosarchaeum limnium BG20 TaxID=859192 RepID=S2EI50_9ARCH|nr:site-specific integrase [Candidatus Nitrosarchaeum limnium]EPA04437.1 site-specific recombinase, phage integrase family [Candidatus Nitrosarchaeum limnium BG20]
MTSFLVEKKNRKSFEDKVSKLSIKTRQNIEASKNSFNRFCQDYYDGRTIDDIFKELGTLNGQEQTEAIRDTLQSWIDWQYQNGSLTSSIKQYISKISRVFSHNGIKIHSDDFDEPLEYKPTTKEELHELTLEEIQKIFAVSLPRRTGFYLALISTGARPGELLQVRKKDIDTTQKRVKIRIEAENVKTRSGRSVWLTREASKLLLTRLKDLSDNDLIWATNENPAHAEKAESTMFNKYTTEAGFTQKYKSNGFRMITLYSFRSFFFGKASDVHREGYAHRMTGHGGYLPQYDRMSDEKRLEWFLKLEPSLTIDAVERQKIMIHQLEQEKLEMKKQIPSLVNEAVERLKKEMTIQGWNPYQNAL